MDNCFQPLADCADSKLLVQLSLVLFFCQVVGTLKVSLSVPRSHALNADVTESIFTCSVLVVRLFTRFLSLTCGTLLHAWSTLVLRLKLAVPESSHSFPAPCFSAVSTVRTCVLLALVNRLKLGHWFDRLAVSTLLEVNHRRHQIPLSRVEELEEELPAGESGQHLRGMPARSSDFIIPNFREFSPRAAR